MRFTATTIVLAVSSFLGAGAALAKGDGTFQGPLTIGIGRPGLTVHAGDLNGDGKLDLIAAHGQASNEPTGTPTIMVLLQNPQNRQDWRSIQLGTGKFTYAVFVRSADFDNDGFDDILVGDTQRTAFFIKSNGDGTFAEPAPIAQARGCRWIAIADWNNDGNLDMATANFTSSSLTIFTGDGTGKFVLTQTLPGSREHTLEALDYDGDGKMDLFQGTGLPGCTAFRGLGDGKVQQRAQVSNLGCIEYIAEVGHYKDGNYVLVGDFNKDGKGDLAPTCIDDQTAYVGVSLGTGIFRQNLREVAGGGTDSSAIADLNGDGNADLALVSMGASTLWVHLGKGDGTFLKPPVTFGPTGATPAFLISRDLDGDGYYDVISADQASTSLTVFWGKEGEQFLEAAVSMTGFSGAKAMAVNDLDRDGKLDLLFPSSTTSLINVYLKPEGKPQTRTTMSIPVARKFSYLEVADLDGDGIPDLAGADAAGGMALVTLLDETLKARGEQLALPAGLSPVGVRVGQLDAGAPPDLLIPCKGSNHLALFMGQGGGAFGEAKVLPTGEKPRVVTLGDIDRDGRNDLAVACEHALVVHFQEETGEYTAPLVLVSEVQKYYYDVAITDLNNDGYNDVVALEARGLGVQFFRGKGTREFETPVNWRIPASPISMQIADVNGDDLLDIITSHGSSRAAVVLLNQGEGGFPVHGTYGLGVLPLGHQIVDVDADGALDIVGFSTTTATVLLGRTERAGAGRFIRGDATGDGRIEVNDPISVLGWLFLGASPVPCQDAADADDDGRIMVNDPIAVLARLFLGGDPLPPPQACGPDETDDQLSGCRTACE